MASLVREPRSPFWYLRFKDGGKWRRHATSFRVGIGIDTRKARELCAEHSLRERQRPTTRLEEWSAWVDGFLRIKAPLTLQRYQAAWNHVLGFLGERKIAAPRDLTFAHCRDYMDFRARAKKTPAHNTALFELKLLGLVMGEAVRRGFSPGNPCRELRISRQKVREKPALTSEQIQLIRAELRTRPAWMAHAFELAIHHGCRIGECRVPMSDIDLKAKLISFRKTKGDKPFIAPIDARLLPLIRSRIKAGAQFLCDVPARNAPKLFHQFFRAIGMDGVSFHCTRVTVATLLARDPSVPEKQAMNYLNHASATVHRAYQRWRPSDVSAVAAAVKLPPMLSESPGSLRANRKRRGKSSASRD